MPTYAYLCTECGHEFEIVQAITDGTLTTCPQCQGSLRKVFHPVGVAFKGSGFYRTDSRAASGSDAAKPATTSAESTGGSAGKDSESKGSKGSESKGSKGSEGKGSATQGGSTKPADSKGSSGGGSGSSGQKGSGGSSP